MRVLYDLMGDDTIVEAIWTPTSGSCPPRHSVVWIEGADNPDDHTTMVRVLVTRSFQNSKDASLLV